MARCQFCGKEAPLPFKCRYCGGKFCVEHHLPPNHNCPGIHKWGRRFIKEEVKDRRLMVCSFCGKEYAMLFKCHYCGQWYCHDHLLPPNHNCLNIALWKSKPPPRVTIRYLAKRRVYYRSVDTPESTTYRRMKTTSRAYDERITSQAKPTQYTKVEEEPRVKRSYTCEHPTSSTDSLDIAGFTLVLIGNLSLTLFHPLTVIIGILLIIMASLFFRKIETAIPLSMLPIVFSLALSAFLNIYTEENFINSIWITALALLIGGLLKTAIKISIS